MAKVSGKCPVCGEVIRVNDEKETGHCGKCGVEISVSESIRLFNANPDANTAPPPQDAALQRRAKREQREREAEAKAQADNAKQHIHDMFQQCSCEQDYLALRSRIMEMSASDTEKARLLEALDLATKERLEDTLKRAKDYAESQESPFSLLVGFAAIIGIGFLINHFFSVKWAGIAAVVLSVIGLLGGLSDRFDKKKIAENKAAAELIAEYRKLGYKI